jgi:long-chain acyl-CoA synthetase
MRQANAEQWSYSELLHFSARLAAGLRARGLTPGERAILLAPNSIEWVTACLALLEAGLIPVPVDSQISRDDLLHILEDSQSTSAFTTALGAERLRRCEVSEKLRVVLLDRAGEHGLFWRELLAEGTREHPKRDSEDCAVLFYTSGTSGPPKGVPLSHANLLSNVAALLEEGLVRPDDRLLLPVPLHHVYPFVVGLLTPLSVGMSVILPRSLIGAHFFTAMNKGEVTILLGVPRLYAALLDAIEQGFEGRARILLNAFRVAMRVSIGARKALRIDLGRWLFAVLRHRIAPRLRLLVSGGSPLELDLAQRLQGLGWPVASGYGLTETSPILTLNLPGVCPVDSAGKALPGVQLRLAEPAPGFRHGEVQAKGPNVFSGYRNLPDKTREAFTEDGWFRTGDLGYFDESGALYLVGRASSMIVLPGGENVVPENLEEVLERSPYISEVGVLDHGGRLVGVVVPERAPGLLLDAGGVEQRIREEVVALSQGLPSYQRLGDLAIDDRPLPRTRLGKIRRHKLAERYTELSSGRPRAQESVPIPPQLTPEDRQLLEDPVVAQVWAWLGERFAGHRVTPDTHLRMDLAVDSLEWLNLTLEIRNRVAVELSDEAVGRIETVRDLLQECAIAEHAVGLQGDILELLRDPESLLDELARAWFRTHPWLSGILDPLAVLLARVLMNVVFHFRVAGLELLPASGPYVLAPNHCSALDPIAVVAALGRRRLHNTYWGGWVGILFRSRLMSVLSHAMRVLPVEPRLGPLSNLGLAAAALRSGRDLVWFPEGGRSPTGELQRFRSGIGLLLRVYSVPVVPVWIEGSRQALPPATLRPRRSAVSLWFGKPVLAAQLEAEGSGETPQERIASGLRARVHALGEAAKRAPGASDA